MTAYLDASALVKRYARETGSAAVVELLTQWRVASSRLSEVEVASALVRRAREGAIEASERDAALAAWHIEIGRIDLIELTAAITARARVLLLRHALRAGDAIQLASALAWGEATAAEVRFLAYDARLQAAAHAEGLRGPA